MTDRELIRKTVMDLGDRDRWSGATSLVIGEYTVVVNRLEEITATKQGVCYPLTDALALLLSNCVIVGSRSGGM